MRRILFLLLAAGLFATACSTARRVPATVTPSWVGNTTSDILDRMGDPIRIDADGQGGSILVYESVPDYNDPKYDILDPDANVAVRRYANFYLDREGICYKVDTNRDLPSPPRHDYASGDDSWLDLLLTISLFLVLFI